MIQLIPKPQYDDEALVQRPETANRSTAKSFRLRTNTFSRIDQPSEVYRTEITNIANWQIVPPKKRQIIGSTH
jgi:Ni/Co efflux regulator RcnB